MDSIYTRGSEFLWMLLESILAFCRSLFVLMGCDENVVFAWGIDCEIPHD